MAHAEQSYSLPGAPSPAQHARQVCQPYLRGWNQAAHDTGGDAPSGLRTEVNAARQACRLLDSWDAP